MEITVYDIFQYYKDRKRDNSPPIWVARFPVRKEAKAYAEEMIEGDFTSYHIQKSIQKDIPQYTEPSSKCPTFKGSVRTLLNNLADAPRNGRMT